MDLTAGKFVGGVRRRIAVARGSESIAIALGAGAGLGVVLMPIAWWCGESGVQLAWGMPAIGLGCGIVWGVTRMPTRLEAAVEADRQLGLDDLLGTIESLGVDAKSGWGDALLNYAEQRCKWARASDVKVKRVGARGWAGVGVLGGLLITLGMFGGRADNAGNAGARLALAGTVREFGASVAQGATDLGEGRPPGTGGVDPSNRGGEQDREGDSDAGLGFGGDEGSHSAGVNASVGGGQAETKGGLEARQEIRGRSDQSGQAGSAGVGVGEAELNAKLRGGNGSTVAMGVAGKTEVAGWSSGEWARDSSKTISVGRVPDEDADMVRDFFERD